MGSARRRGSGTSLRELPAAVEAGSERRITAEAWSVRLGDVRDRLAGLELAAVVLGDEQTVVLRQGLGRTRRQFLGTAADGAPRGAPFLQDGSLSGARTIRPRAAELG